MTVAIKKKPSSRYFPTRHVRDDVAGTPAAQPAGAPPAGTPPARRAPASAPASRGSIDPARLDDIVTKAVRAAVDAVFQQGGAPAVHTEERRDRREYIDDAIGEVVGDERMEVRRESEARTRQQQERPWSRPEHGSSSIHRARADSFFGRERKPEGTLVAEYLSWLVRAGGDIDRAERMAKKAGASDLMVRALQASTFAAGGAFVPENIQADFIELLYNNSVYLKAGPNRLTVVNGNLTIPKMTGGASVYWLGESQNITPSQQSTGQVRIDLRQVAALTPASNIFLRDSGPSGIEMIRQDLAEAAGVGVDVVALRSLGTSWTPRGLRGWVPTSHTFAAGGTSIALITTDVMHAFRILEDAKIKMTRMATFTSPRTKYGLVGAKDGLNRPIWAEEIMAGTWYGATFGSTQNIPTDVGSGGTKSEIYFVDMAHQIFAEAPEGIRIDVSDGAAYYDGSAVVSGFSRDESAVRLIQRCDIVSRQSGNEIVEIYDVAIA